MADYNFADQYRAAGLAPGSDIIRLRQSAFDDLRENLNIDNILDLTRIYFGLTVPSGTDWFRNAFSENDLSFSMIDNEREAAVLAVCLLSASLSDGNINAGLVPIVTAINRHRSPVLQPNFLNEAFHRLDELSIKSEQGCCITVDKIETPKECQISTDIDDFEESPTDILKLAEIVRTAHEASSEASKTIVKQVTDVVYPLVERVDMLREEVSMLWWYIGGWSRKLNKPFADLDIGLAALMAGLDLAHLTQRKNGPIAARAILQRVFIDCRSKPKKEITLDSAIESLPDTLIGLLDFPEKLKSMEDLCPVSSAIVKYQVIGGNAAWHAQFKKSTALDPTILFTPIELSMQIYRESLLLSNID